jgi:methylthioribose-1-phosphate isomerase
MIPTIEWRDGTVILVDQRMIPRVREFITCATADEMAAAIRDMVVRGAPAIGVAAAMGYALAALRSTAGETTALLAELDSGGKVLKAARPTAVNLAWAVDKMALLAGSLADRPAPEVVAALVAEARRMHDEDIAINRAMGRHGEVVIPDGGTVLTHCNAGALATAGYGTALGVIRAAVEAGKKVSVIADETRPWLQGARLTAWELMEDGIPVTLICDNQVGWQMKRGGIDVVIVGADRIAANGDTANKIGTYSVSILAAEHKIPFYVAAPLSTVDFSLADGSGIPIEERGAEEVTCIGGVRIAPEGVKVRNPAFDVTPAAKITGIITERGIARPPFAAALRALAG